MLRKVTLAGDLLGLKFGQNLARLSFKLKLKNLVVRVSKLRLRSCHKN